MKSKNIQVTNKTLANELNADLDLESSDPKLHPNLRTT
jgi:hypothetical protein